MSLQPSNLIDSKGFSTEAQLPKLEQHISVAPIRTLAQAKALAPAIAQSTSQKLVYGAAILLSIFAIGQCIRACAVHAIKLQSLMSANQAVHDSRLNNQAENLDLRDQIALYQSKRGVEILARERLNLVGENEVLVQIFTEDATR